MVPRSAWSIPRADHASEAARKWATEELEDCAGKARAQGLRARVALRTGVAYREIVALAREEGADLIVVATLGRGGIDRRTGRVPAFAQRPGDCARGRAAAGVRTELG